MDQSLSQPFEDEQERAVVSLVVTYNHLLGMMQAALKPFKINDQHYNVLKMLEAHYPEHLQVGTIKELLFNKRGDLTRLLDKLYQMGLITRETNSHNRRMVDIRLSEQGSETLKEIDVQLEGYRQLRKNLSEEEAQQLVTLLEKLRTP
ncbi:MAG: MarR family transcriptional regulator [Chloroflexota bacterium]